MDFIILKKKLIDEHNEDLGINEDTMNENINEGIA